MVLSVIEESPKMLSLMATYITDENGEIHYHSNWEHLQVSKVAKFGCDFCGNQCLSYLKFLKINAYTVIGYIQSKQSLVKVNPEVSFS